MLEQQLHSLGLTEKEAKVYLALLGVDNASASEIAQQTDIKRPTVYVMIESLENKGLVSETTEGKRTRYQAEPPERLETYVSRRRQELAEQSKRLESDVIPQLKGVQRGEGEPPVVKYFEGKEGLVSANSEIYRDYETGQEDQPIHLIYSRDLLEKVFTEKEAAGFRDERISRDIVAKVLYTWSKGDYTAGTGMSERVRLDEEEYPIDCDIAILGDKVRIGIVGDKPYGVFIQSTDFANTMRTLFKAVFERFQEESEEESDA